MFGRYVMSQSALDIAFTHTSIQFLQIFFADTRFSKFQKNDFALWTESYGGHYGPTFAA